MVFHRGPPRGHMAAKGCPGFVVDFNNCSINVDDSMSLISLLHEVLQLYITWRQIIGFVITDNDMEYCSYSLYNGNNFFRQYIYEYIE